MPRGFTLIDVLVSLAIVALLVALIAPSISKSLQAARQTKCASNLREIQRGMMVYVDAYQSTPIWNEYPTDEERAIVDVPDAVWRCPSDPNRGVNRRGGQTSYDASGFRAMRWHSLRNGDRFTNTQTDMTALAVAWDHSTCHFGKRNRVYANGMVRLVP